MVVLTVYLHDESLLEQEVNAPHGGDVVLKCEGDTCAPEGNPRDRLRW